MGCQHAKVCRGCAEKKGVCAFCSKPARGSKEDVAKLQAALDKDLAGHKLGRELPNELAKKLLPDVRFTMVSHPDAPCKTCRKHSEPLAAAEKEKVTLIASEEQLSELLIRQGLAGKEEAALCAAQLVQALWEPAHGGSQPDKVQVAESKSSGKAKFVAEFEYKKGHAAWNGSVALDADGNFIELQARDSGKKCH
jgi:hypothetical protein